MGDLDRPRPHDGAPRPKRTAVLIHGIEDGRESWSPLIAALGPAFDCIAPELPWRAGNDYGWRAQRSPSQWLAWELERLHSKIDLLIGHSFGANVVIEHLLFAGSDGTRATPADRTKAGVLIAPIYRLRSESLTWETFAALRTKFERQIVKGLQLRLRDRGPAIDLRLLRRMGEMALERAGPLAFLSVFDRYAASAVLDLGEIAVPILVVGGHGDPMSSDGRAEALASELPGSTLVVDHRFDHFCHVRHPDETASAIADFWETVPGVEADRR